MKLEHGKRYVMRNGEITPPVCDMRRHGLPPTMKSEFHAIIDLSVNTWFSDGTNADKVNAYDIVADGTPCGKLVEP